LYARYWFYTFDAIDWSDDRMNQAFRWENIELFRTALEAGTGAIAVLPHFGNWDVAGRAMAAQSMPVLSVAERLKPERLFELFLEHRRALRMDIVALDDKRVGRALADAIAGNRIVALVCDRDLTGRGIPVEMFGATRMMPLGPAMLALSTGAPLVAAAVHTTDEGWTCVLSPVDAPRTGERRTDAAALTAAIAAEFERIISTEPADWHLFQPGWE
jgi:KDO2-lipid IV(A) lauroyltransferase